MSEAIKEAGLVLQARFPEFRSFLVKKSLNLLLNYILGDVFKKIIEK